MWSRPNPIGRSPCARPLATFPGPQAHAPRAPPARSPSLSRVSPAFRTKPFAHTSVPDRVRQQVLVTDEEAGQKAFYESFALSQHGESLPRRAFVRFTNAPI